MALVKFVHLLAVLSFAIFQVSFVTLPANALAVERGYIGRDHVHAGIIKRQDGPSKRCKPRKKNDKPSSPANPNNGSTTYEHSSALTTTTTSTAPSRQTPTSTPSGGSKRILLWANGVQGSLRNFIGPNSDILIFRWALAPYNSDALGPSYDLFQKSKFLPQLWGHQEDLNYLKKNMLSGQVVYPTIASFNEPNQQGQVGLSPGAAVNMWLEYMQPLAKYSKLNSPAVTADGLQWMTDFVHICAGRCSINAMDIHIYEIEASQVIKYANQFHDQFKMDVWVGEIACHSYANKGPCSPSTFETFYGTVVKFFEDTPWIARFGWFGFFEGPLPNGVSESNRMLHCDNVAVPSTCHPTDIGKRFLSGN